MDIRATCTSEAAVGGQPRRATCLLMLCLSLAGSGCIVVPVPSVTPDYRKGVIEDSILDSLIGLDQEQVAERIGQPDFAGPGEESYLLVYQGEKRYSTEVYAAVSAGYTAAAGKIDDGSSSVLRCQVLELAEDGTVRDYEVVSRPVSGITKRDSTGTTLDPVADCSEVVWSPGERGGILTKIQILRARAETGDRSAAMDLASNFDDLEYLKSFARDGDREAIFLLARRYDDTEALEGLASQGDVEAAKSLVRLTGEATEPLRELARGGDLEAAELLARNAGEPDALRALADNGDYRAAQTLASSFGDDSYVASLAEEGYPEAAFHRYEQLRTDDETLLLAWRWLCVAANGGYANAQAEVGLWHGTARWDAWKGWNEAGLERLREAGVRPDDRLAYMWYTLAISAGDDAARATRDRHIAQRLAPHDITRAERMARDWKPGECPNGEAPLGPTS